MCCEMNMNKLWWMCSVLWHEQEGTESARFSDFQDYFRDSLKSRPSSPTFEGLKAWRHIAQLITRYIRITLWRLWHNILWFDTSDVRLQVDWPSIGSSMCFTTGNELKVDVESQHRRKNAVWSQIILSSSCHTRWSSALLACNATKPTLQSDYLNRIPKSPYYRTAGQMIGVISNTFPRGEFRVSYVDQDKDHIVGSRSHSFHGASGDSPRPLHHRISLYIYCTHMEVSLDSRHFPGDAQ